uniref:Putative secreted protein n=1 Tax=Anopheles darlingi TaxID=43151 RepID=A0A2M4D027_ANODA
MPLLFVWIFAITVREGVGYCLFQLNNLFPSVCVPIGFYFLTLLSNLSISVCVSNIHSPIRSFLLVIHFRLQVASFLASYRLQMFTPLCVACYCVCLSVSHSLTLSLYLCRVFDFLFYNFLLFDVWWQSRKHGIQVKSGNCVVFVFH